MLILFLYLFLLTFRNVRSCLRGPEESEEEERRKLEVLRRQNRALGFEQITCYQGQDLRAEVNCNQCYSQNCAVQEDGVATNYALSCEAKDGFGRDTVRGLADDKVTVQFEEDESQMKRGETNHLILNNVTAMMLMS